MRNVSFTEAGSMLTSDGCVTAIADLQDVDGCCPPDICNVDPCAIMCNYIELLPNGPLWDKAKALGMEKYRSGLCDAPACMPSGACQSLVDYAAYSGYRLATLIQGPLWSAIRESSPDTAVETLDSWLELYGWSDCWTTVCRDQRLGPNPLECTNWVPTLDKCDSNFSPIYVPQMPTQLELAVKRGVVRALSRQQMQPIKNLCGINWVIEPLGAVLMPDPSRPANECCGGMGWLIQPRSPQIEAAPGLTCNAETRMISASFEINSLEFNPVTGVCEARGADKIKIWPAVMAAQCIALSMIPAKDCETPITRVTPE